MTCCVKCAEHGEATEATERDGLLQSHGDASMSRGGQVVDLCADCARFVRYYEIGGAKHIGVYDSIGMTMAEFKERESAVRRARAASGQPDLWSPRLAERFPA